MCSEKNLLSRKCFGSLWMELLTPTRLEGWRSLTGASQPQEIGSVEDWNTRETAQGWDWAVGQGAVKSRTTLFYTGRAKNLFIPLKIISRITQVWKLFSLVLPPSLCTADYYMLKRIQTLLFMWEEWSMLHKCYDVFCTSRTINRYKYY